MQTALSKTIKTAIGNKPATQSRRTTLEEAFPDVNPEFRAFGGRILVQIRTPKKITDGGLHIPAEARDHERWNTQIGKVIELGPLAFKNKSTMDPWPEGAWCQKGQYIRVTRFGGDRWKIPIPGGDAEDYVLFVLFEDHQLLGEHLGDPLAVIGTI